LAAAEFMQLPHIDPGPISIAEFLPVLLASEVKLELIDGVVVPFANGTVAHSHVCERVVRALRGSADRRGEVFTSQIGLQRVDAPTYVFPDASYTVEAVEPGAETIVSPLLIVEVMSPLSVQRDRVEKLDTYQAIPSIQEYLIVDSRRVWAAAYRRSAGLWTHTNYGPGDAIELSSIGRVAISIGDLYAEKAS
jgi:Uma2 family endonuclease